MNSNSRLDINKIHYSTSEFNYPLQHLKTNNLRLNIKVMLSHALKSQRFKNARSG